MTNLLAQATDPNPLGALYSNGPWALVAGFLLWTVIKAWTGDREQVTSLLSEFKGAIEGLRVAVDSLVDRLDKLDGTDHK